MVSLAIDEREIIFLYDPNKKLHRECYAYVESASYKSNVINLSESKPTGTQWLEIARLLDVEPISFLDTNHSDFTAEYGEDRKPDTEGVLTILNNNPEAISYPIIIRGKRGMICKSYGDVARFHDPDTAAIDIP